jgi:hypothetical protein
MRLFAAGVLKRWYFWVWAVLLDPADFWGRYVAPHARWAEAIDLNLGPVKSGLAALSMVVIAAFFTFHAERKKWWTCESRVARIELCKTLLNDAPDTSHLQKQDPQTGGMMEVETTDDERSEIEEWLLRIETSLSDTGRFALIRAEVDRRGYSFSVRHTKGLLTDYIAELS